ncbi:MAG: NAD(P)/FAD-dependent oxidoreductase [Candidatus Eisenbacteria bacterium]
MRDADVIVIGGGVMGCSTAWHLREDGVTGRIVVIERDPDDGRSSSMRAMGGIRQQFASAVNVALVRYSVRFWRAFDERMSDAGHVARANFRPRGYLFLADDGNAASLEARLARMRDARARVERLEPAEVARRWPGIATTDLRFALFGPEDGYANPREVLRGFRAAARARGVEFVTAEATAIERRGGQVSGVRLAADAVIDSAVVVIAAGAWSAAIARSVGIELPIAPQRQHLFRAALAEPWPYRFPMTVDPTGVHWRHEDDDRGSDRDVVIVARTRADEPVGECMEPDLSRWASEFLPPMARRAPGLASVELLEGWAGFYEVTPDHNPLLGAHPALGGLHVAAGFSGHGLMMSPAVGKVMSEIVRLGRAELTDVSMLAPDRFDRGAPFEDGAMI